MGMSHTREFGTRNECIFLYRVIISYPSFFLVQVSHNGQNTAVFGTANMHVCDQKYEV